MTATESPAPNIFPLGINSMERSRAGEGIYDDKGRAS